MNKALSTDKFPAGVSQPAIRGFASAGYFQLDELAGKSEAELRRLHGVGPKAIRIVRRALINVGQEPLKP